MRAALIVGAAWLLQCATPAWAAPAPAKADVQLTDGGGHTLRLPAPARRIISLSPAHTDMVFALGAERALVGAIAYDDHPPGASHLLSVGTVAGLDYERIVMLKPELIIAWHGGTPLPWIERLRALGLPTFVSRTEKLTDISLTLRQLGRLTGHNAEQIAGRFDARLAGLTQQYANRKPVSVFYQVWQRPLMTLNKQHIIGDALLTCGARNVFGDNSNLIPQVSTEAVVAARPEIIVTATAPAQDADPKATAPAQDNPLAQWQRFPEIPAVRDNRLLVLNADQITRPTVPMLDAVEQLCTAVDQARRAN